ncbi:MAG: hypothetical protein NW201_01550 [Gemmatimonadales bacterium]|nr:hypothetical protein [Gemmatimonadales bacterium]
MPFRQVTAFGLPAVALRNADLECLAAPAAGALIANLRRPGGREWIVPATAPGGGWREWLDGEAPGPGTASLYEQGGRPSLAVAWTGESGRLARDLTLDAEAALLRWRLDGSARGAEWRAVLPLTLHEVGSVSHDRAGTWVAFDARRGERLAVHVDPPDALEVSLGPADGAPVALRLQRATDGPEEWRVALVVAPPDGR